MNMWKLSILALAGVGAVAIGASAAGCTVTSSSNGVDGGQFNGTDSGTGSETSTSEAGTDGGTEGGSCAATQACAIIGGNGGVSFDSCGKCDDCLATKCCTQSDTCFKLDSDGGDPCYDLFDCYDKCEAAAADAGPDGGDSTTCRNSCATAYPANVVQQANDMNTCATTNCKAECGI